MNLSTGFARVELLAVLLLVAASVLTIVSTAGAQEKAKEPTKHELDLATCEAKGEAAGDEALKKATLESPADAMKIKSAAKRFAFNSCMRRAGYASGQIREK